MKTYASIFYKTFSMLLFSLVWVSLEAVNFDDSEIKKIGYPGWFNENPYNELDDITRESIENNKKGLFVLFTTEGCSYCEHFIKTSLNNPQISSLVQKNFESVGLEIFDDKELITPDGETKTVKQFAKDEKVQFSPTLLFYGDKGKNLMRITGYQSPERFTMVLNYLIDKRYQHESFQDYLLRNKTDLENTGVSRKTLTADPLFEKPPYMLDRSHFPASNPLLVLFEETDCSACENFHSEVLSRKDIRNMMEQFEVVRLNTKDARTPIVMPDSGKTTPAKWFRESEFTRTPALLFFDNSGMEVLKSDTLILTQRMNNSLKYVLEKAYEKGWSYQRFARSKALERRQKNN